VNSISALEIRHRMAAPVIAIGKRVHSLAGVVVRFRWPRSARHARTQAIILAILLWLAAGVVSFTGQGDRSIAGPLKGPDFIQFFTMGHLAAAGRVETMYDMRALHDAQVDLVPASQRDFFPPVYPPQASLLFMPFTGWSYQPALLLWSILTIVLYGVIVWSAWRRVAGQLSDRGLVIAAAAAFPPFWALVVYGQITVLVLAAFWLGWLALEHGRPHLAGVAFGLLALKPQFGIPLAAVVLACGEWRMLAGAVFSIAAQTALVWFVLGSSAFGAFAATLRFALTHADLLESKPFMSHSLRAVTRIFPDWMGVPLWGALAAVVLWYTVLVWKSEAPVRVRLGVVILASLLVNPHVIVYDVTLLALPLLWFGAYMLEPQRQEHAPGFGVLVYWLFVALFIPTAAVIGVQMSVPLMMVLLMFMSRAVASPSLVH
jgi:alpha-1,2-mannosyltransferase